MKLFVGRLPREVNKWLGADIHVRYNVYLECRTYLCICTHIYIMIYYILLYICILCTYAHDTYIYIYIDIHVYQYFFLDIYSDFVKVEHVYAYNDMIYVLYIHVTTTSPTLIPKIPSIRDPASTAFSSCVLCWAIWKTPSVWACGQVDNHSCNATYPRKL